jgi:signal transduction histidine kinase
LASFTEKRLSLHRALENRQTENQALKDRLGQLQALANLGTASFMIAHEMNNLLTPVRSYAALAMANPHDEALVVKALAKAVRNCERASKVMESMLAMANGSSQERKESRLRPLVDGVFTCLSRDFEKDGITVDIQIPEGLAVWGSPEQIQQVLMNLILNGRDAMLGRGGVLKIRAVGSRDRVEIEVSDTGEGIEADDLSSIFEPFFTTKTGKHRTGERSGSGVGLAFCREIIDAHGGVISVESEPSQGSTFRVILPKPQSGKN